MRAAMKLATGVVPVALGVTMALMSGMAKAEDKAVQPQPLTNAVSAKTTLPSVGHRDKHSVNGIRNDADQSFPPNKDWLWVVGDRIYTSSILLADDPDNAFGASEEVDRTHICKKYRVAPNGHEEFLEELANCERNSSDRTLHRATEADIGHRIKFVFWWETDPGTTRGYTASPSKTLEQIVMSPPVSDLFHYDKVTIVTNNQNISAADNQRTLTTTVKDVNGNPVRGLSITYYAKRDFGLSTVITPSVDNGDGSYTAQITSNAAVSHYVHPVINGTQLSTTVYFKVINP